MLCDPLHMRRRRLPHLSSQPLPHCAEGKGLSHRTRLPRHTCPPRPHQSPPPIHTHAACELHRCGRRGSRAGAQGARLSRRVSCSGSASASQQVGDRQGQHLRPCWAHPSCHTPPRPPSRNSPPHASRLPLPHLSSSTPCARGAPSGARHHTHDPHTSTPPAHAGSRLHRRGRRWRRYELGASQASSGEGGTRFDGQGCRARGGRQARRTAAVQARPPRLLGRCIIPAAEPHATLPLTGLTTSAPRTPRTPPQMRGSCPGSARAAGVATSSGAGGCW